MCSSTVTLETKVLRHRALPRGTQSREDTNVKRGVWWETTHAQGTVQGRGGGGQQRGGGRGPGPQGQKRARAKGRPAAGEGERNWWAMRLELRSETWQGVISSSPGLTAREPHGDPDGCVLKKAGDLLRFLSGKFINGVHGRMDSPLPGAFMRHRRSSAPGEPNREAGGTKCARLHPWQKTILSWLHAWFAS